MAGFPGRVVLGGPLSPVGWRVGFRPEGEPPLHYVRTVSARVFDEGRWEFEALGEPQPFEEAGRRLDRDLLLHYLSVLCIEADDPAAYGEGMLVRTRGPWRARTSTIEETQREYGIAAET